MEPARAEIETLADRAAIRPRDPEKALERALKELALSQRLNPGVLKGDRYEDSHAEGQYYVIEYGEDTKPVTGLAIGAALVLGRHWTNILNKVRLTGETEDAFDCGALCVDLETMFAIEKFRRESKWYRSRRTNKLVKYREDRYVQVAGKCASIAQRNAYLAVIPEPIQVAYWNECKRLVAATVAPAKKGKAAPGPGLKELIPKMLAFLEKYGVTPDHLAKKLGHPVESITPEEFAQMKGICSALKSGETDAYQAFGAGAPAGDENEEETVVEDDPLAESRTVRG